VCYGWFASNNLSNVNDFNVGLNGPDIKSMAIKAHKLKNKTSSTQNGTVYTTYDLDTEISELSNMNTYDMLSDEVTAVLIGITYTMNGNVSSSRKYTLSLDCSMSSNYSITKDDIYLKDEERDIYTCNLSYAVGFNIANVSLDGSVVTAEGGSALSTFAQVDNNQYVIKNNSLTIDGDISLDTNEKTVTVYVIMDYHELNINILYTLLLEKGSAGLESQFSFNDDITFTLQEGV
jgi:hypothetical protein